MGNLYLPLTAFDPQQAMQQPDPRDREKSTAIGEPGDVCMGICCSRHATCQRYVDFEGATDRKRIGRCADFSMYVEVKA
jgi:hypothetical protein